VIARGITVPPAANPVFHQLTARRGFVFSARFTPDGQSVVYGAAWDGRPVELFTTRASRAESSPLPISSADVLSVSPSGELAISLGRQYVNGFASSGTLARGAVGTAPREIAEDVQDADWDGDQDLVITRRVGGQHRLEWPIGRVLQSTAGWISHPRLSPNRDLVAFFEHPLHGDDRGAVAVIDRQGARRILSDGWASMNGLAWSPSTGEVWFTATRSGTRRELFGVSLAGEVRSLWRGPGSLTLYDVAPDGRVLLGQESLRSIVAGLAPGARDERDLSWTDFSLGHDLSDDGRTVLLSEGGVGTGPLYDAYLRRMDGSPATRLGEGQPMALSPDQKWVLILMLTSPPELLLVPTRAGSPRRLPRGRIQEYSYVASWFPDGSRVLFQGRESSGRERLYAQSVDGGEPVAITLEGVHLPIFTDPISPNGATVAAFGPDERVRLYGVGGGATIVPGLAVGEAPLLWSRDGNSLFTVERQGAARMRLNKVDLRTQRKTFVRDIAPPVAGLMSIIHVQAAMDTSAYIYSYWQRLTDLYVVNGVR
jgi:Tol biopolymer transport system component